MKDIDAEFETHDIYLAAYLKIAGCTMLKRYRTGQRWHFVFTNTGGSIKDMREAFYSNAGMVQAKKYADEIINFKQLCFE